MAALAPPQPRSVRTTRSLYVSLAVLCLLIVFIGFSRTFYLNSFFAHRDLSSLRIAHGIVFSGWLVLLVAQVSLVALRRTDLHGSWES